MNTMEQQQMYSQQPFMVPCGFQNPVPLPMTNFPQIPGFTPCFVNFQTNQAMPMPIQGFSPPFLPVQNQPSPSPCFLPPMMLVSSPINQSAPSMVPVNSVEEQKSSYLQISRTPYLSHSRSPSPSSYSPSREDEFSRERSMSRTSCENGEKSKKELVDSALVELSKDFGPNFDTDGLRGKNILRIKVKTRIALDNIVNFIRFCQRENLIERVSCPISTKKGRQHVRGFLAYLQARNEADTDRLCELFEQFNAMNDSPFKAYQRDPKSTLFKNLVGAEA